MDTERPGLPLNDETDYGLCFACGPRNPSGLRLRFERAEETVTTRFRGREEHQGFPGYLHGGVITALLDEVMSRVSLLDNRWTMTARIDVRFRQPIMVGQEVTAFGEKAEERRGGVGGAGKGGASGRQRGSGGSGDLRLRQEGDPGPDERRIPRARPRVDAGGLAGYLTSLVYRPPMSHSAT